MDILLVVVVERTIVRWVEPSTYNDERVGTVKRESRVASSCLMRAAQTL